MNLEIIESKIKKVLEKEHTSKEKHIIRRLNGRLNFACPICGDSFKDNKMKRGNLYLANFNYVCYNGGCPSYSIDFLDFLKRFNETIPSYLQIEISDIKQTAKKIKQDLNDVKPKNNILFSPDEFSRKLNLFEIGNFPRIDNILKERKISHLKDKIKVDIIRDGYWILNLINGGIVGAQFRNLNPHKSKYISYPNSHIQELLDSKIELDPYYVELLDKESLIFGLYDIDTDYKITILEGATDHFFIPNSVSSSGLKHLNYVNELFEKENRRFLLDNDKDGLFTSDKLIKNKESVFSWCKFLANESIEGEFKDVNDIAKFDTHKVKKMTNSNYYLDDTINWNMAKIQAKIQQK